MRMAPQRTANLIQIPGGLRSVPPSTGNTIPAIPTNFTTQTIMGFGNSIGMTTNRTKACSKCAIQLPWRKRVAQRRTSNGPTTNEFSYTTPITAALAHLLMAGGTAIQETWILLDSQSTVSCLIERNHSKSWTCIFCFSVSFLFFKFVCVELHTTQWT